MGKSLHCARTARALCATFRLDPPEEPRGVPSPNGLKILLPSAVHVEERLTVSQSVP